MAREIIELLSGYAQAKRSKQEPKKFVYPTVEEIKLLSYRDTVYFIDRGGNYRECRVNGQPKVWKTRPEDVSIPLKYGLKECFTADWRNGRQTSLDPILIAYNEEKHNA